MQSQAYDVILNVLLGIRRALSDLSNATTDKLPAHAFKQYNMTKTDFVSSRAT